VNAVPLSDLLVSLPGDGFSLRIAGDWRADHSRDVVDTEPKMTKALLIARIQGCSQGQPNTRHERILSKYKAVYGRVARCRASVSARAR